MERLATPAPKAREGPANRGFLITGVDYLLTPKLTLFAVLDGRSYYGLHYREVRDLLGGTYTTSVANRNAPATTLLRNGDKIGYNYDDKTQWLGGYGQLECKTPLLSVVLSGTVSLQAHRLLSG